MNADLIERQQRTFHAFTVELGRIAGARPEVLTAAEAEFQRIDDQALQLRRAERKERDTLEYLREEIEARIASGGPSTERMERRATFFTWARFGASVRDGMADAEKRWAEQRRRTGLRLERKSMVISDDTAGGFLAPSEYVQEILRATANVSPMRELAKVRPTSGRSAIVQKRTGSGVAVWVEDDPVPATETTNPTWGEVEIPVHDARAETYLSYSALEDNAFNFEDELRTEFSEQFATAEGTAVVTGDGLGKPFGFLDAGQGVATTNSGTSGSVAAATGAKGDSIIAMTHAVKQEYADRGTLVLNRNTLASVRKLADSAGNYLWQPTTAAGGQNMIGGFPYAVLPAMPNEAAGAKAIAFGDWKRGYCIADRITLVLVRDPYTRANQGQVKFLARRRVGGQVVIAEAIRTLTCS